MKKFIFEKLTAFFIDFNPTFSDSPVSEPKSENIPSLTTTKLVSPTSISPTSMSSTSVSPTTTELDCTEPNPCPENWILGQNGYCFNYFHEKQTYQKASEMCSSHGAFLPHVRSKLDDNYLILLQCYTEKAKLFSNPETVRSRTSQWIGIDRIYSDEFSWQDTGNSLDVEEYSDFSEQFSSNENRKCVESVSYLFDTFKTSSNNSSSPSDFSNSIDKHIWKTTQCSKLQCVQK